MPLPSEGTSKGESDAGELDALEVGFVCVIRRVGGNGGAGFFDGEDIEFEEASRLDADKAGRGLLPSFVR
jgi:hypothetical protein